MICLVVCMTTKNNLTTLTALTNQSPQKTLTSRLIRPAQLPEYAVHSDHPDHFDHFNHPNNPTMDSNLQNFVWNNNGQKNCPERQFVNKSVTRVLAKFAKRLFGATSCTKLVKNDNLQKCCPKHLLWIKLSRMTTICNQTTLHRCLSRRRLSSTKSGS